VFMLFQRLLPKVNPHTNLCKIKHYPKIYGCGDITLADFR
jgi:hypothetical protein